MITSWAPMPFILSNNPSPCRLSSPSMPKAGNLLGTTRSIQPGKAFDADDVEAIVYIMEVISSSILASDAANLSLLGPMHSFFWPSASVICPGLHLDERECATIPTDQIDLAKRFSIVAGDDL